ncbi:MAG TPA: hypothetical protein VHO48_00650, partial [Anaerolineaceae bacterium]|nr:hypothetical protein [Anaerolineaceae bacterium]
MSIPTSQPIPDDDVPSGEDGTSGAYIHSAARRRRARRLTIPQGLEERAAFLDDLAYRVTPSFDFFLYSLVA